MRIKEGTKESTMQGIIEGLSEEGMVNKGIEVGNM